MITHHLEITSFKTKDFDEKSKVVVSVGWTLSASNGERTVSFKGQSIWEEPGEDFTPFDELTKEQVKGWVESAEPLDAHRLSLEQQLNWDTDEDQAQEQALPWGTT